ncbi:hypothetical protein GIB67_006228, partial [Kingdonia uniflora]
MASWSNIPHDLLDVISENFTIMNDLVCSGAVCVNWQYYFTLHSSRPLPRKLPRQAPVFMIPGEKERTRSFCNLFSGLELGSNIPMPFPRDDYHYPSTHGWFLIGDPDLTKVHLFNPFLSVNNRIDLPPLIGIGSLVPVGGEPLHIKSYIKKAVLSANPTFTTNYAIMVIFGACGMLGFYRSGDQDWTPVGKLMCFHDVVYFKNEFYAVDQHGLVVACDVCRPHPKLRKIVPSPQQPMATQVYLVESLGELLLVRRNIDINCDHSNDTVFITCKFSVFKLVDPPILHIKYPIGKGKYIKKIVQKPTPDMYWVEMKTLSGQSKFLVENSTFSISSTDFSQCKANRIYFADEMLKNCPKRSWDLDIFNIENRTFVEHPVLIASKALIHLDEFKKICNMYGLTPDAEVLSFLDTVSRTKK